MLLRRWVTLGCLLSLIWVGTACDLFGESSGPDSLAGAWQGSVTAEDSTYSLILNLEQPPNTGSVGGSVSGDGRLSAADTSWTLEVRGSVAESDLSLTLEFTGARPAYLQGTVDEELQTIEGEVSGGPVSFDAASVTIERE